MTDNRCHCRSTKDGYSLEHDKSSEWYHYWVHTCKKPSVFAKKQDILESVITYPSDDWQKDNMRRIEIQLIRWKDEYYNKLSTVDDATYDGFWQNLLFLEEKYPHLKNPESVTDMVGSPIPQDMTPSIEDRTEELGNFHQV